MKSVFLLTRNSLNALKSIVQAEVEDKVEKCASLFFKDV